MAEPTVIDNTEDERFEVRVDGEVAGFAQYRRDGDRYVFTHTEIDDEFEGEGLGGTLASGALDAVREAGGRVVPLCPFIAGYIDRHEDYADLVDHEQLAELAGD